MKRALLTLMAVLLVSGGMSSAVFAESKIAIVDVPAIVAKSAQVQALKKEQQTKMQELDKWLNTVKADIDKQKTKEGKEKLIQKYNTDFAKKRDAIAKNYQTKLKAIDKSITDTIASQARANGYDMVISKGVVLYGGTDITAEIQKVVK